MKYSGFKLIHQPEGFFFYIIIIQTPLIPYCQRRISYSTSSINKFIQESCLKSRPTIWMTFRRKINLVIVLNTTL